MNTRMLYVESSAALGKKELSDVGVGSFINAVGMGKAKGDQLGMEKY